MGEEGDKGLTTQPSRLAVVMLAILLACVGAAWWLVRTGGGGAKIIGEVRARGLAAYWGQEPQSLFYVVSVPGGKPTWRVLTRKPIDKGYVGGTYQPALRIPLQDWQLSDDAASGQYQGLTGAGEPQSLTIITLRDRRVGVQQTDAPGLLARAPAPANYIPEGMTELVIRLVALSGRQATFKTIFNQACLRDDRGQLSVNFTDLRMYPLDGNTVRTESGTDRTPDVTIYHLDPQGLIVTEDFNDKKVVCQLTPPDKIIEMFPDDKVLRALVEQAAGASTATAGARASTGTKPTRPARPPRGRA